MKIEDYYLHKFYFIILTIFNLLFFNFIVQFRCFVNDNYEFLSNLFSQNPFPQMTKKRDNYQVLFKGKIGENEHKKSVRGIMRKKTGSSNVQKMLITVNHFHNVQIIQFLIFCDPFLLRKVRYLSICHSNTSNFIPYFLISVSFLKPFLLFFCSFLFLFSIFRSFSMFLKKY